MRRAHVLKPNRVSQEWQEFAFLQVVGETKATSKTTADTRWGGAWGQHVRRGRPPGAVVWFDAPDALWEWVASLGRAKRRTVLVTSGLYRLLRLSGGYRRLPKLGYDVGKYWFAEDAPTSFVYATRRGAGLLLLDAWNVLPLTESQLADMLGPDARLQRQEVIATGGERDRARVLLDHVRDAVLRFYDTVKAQDLGNPAKTLAAQALNAFRHRLMPHAVFIHDHAGALQLEQDAYHGGRTECFRVGAYNGRFYKLDVNSMYPAVMWRHEFPVKLRRYWGGGVSVDLLRHYVKRYYVIADVQVRAAEPRYPYVEHGRTLYPVGEFPTVLCQASLLDALARDEIVSCQRAALYVAAPVFRDFVDYFWRQRALAQREGREQDATIYKLLLNSLYGKFGQRRTPVLHEEPCDPDKFTMGYAWHQGRRYLQWWCFGKHVTFDAQRELAHSAFPAIAAGVTDLARQYLWWLCLAAGEQHVYYCDTDAVIVDEEGKTALLGLMGSGLGELKVEQAGTRLEIRAPKDYTLDSVVKRKGIRADARYNNQTGEWEQRQEQQFRGGLRAGSLETITVKTVGVKEGRDIIGRTVSGDGLTHPLYRGVTARSPGHQ